ncbi:MAG: AlpA family phage regulatory protein [Chlorobium phaeovibrioides]|nr:AlpA family phage regulatory protein [Chlorobium phaeovibrioides]
MSELRLYRLADIIGDKKQGIKPIIPVGRSSWYRGIQDGRYPKPVMLTKATPAWRSDEIDALIEKVSQESAAQR